MDKKKHTRDDALELVATSSDGSQMDQGIEMMYYHSWLRVQVKGNGPGRQNDAVLSWRIMVIPYACGGHTPG